MSERVQTGASAAVMDEDGSSVVVRKDQRIQEKLRLARALLAELSRGHARHRLLHAAIVRRDEVLLDGLLHELADDGSPE